MKKRQSKKYKIVSRTQLFANASRKRIYDLMKDRKWHDRDEILSVASGPETIAREGMRRMRELRKLFTIEARLKDPETNLFEYKIAGK